METNAENKSHFLRNTTRIRLGFMDRIRALFGNEIRVTVNIELDKEVNVLKSDAKTVVQSFF